MTRDEWIALAAKCEGATGPDREIDAAVLKAIGYEYDAVADYQWAWVDRDGGIVASTIPLTNSLDAITALIERELPGWIWTVYSKAIGPHPLPRATVVATDYRTQIGCNAHTPALALCAAFCKAMSAKAPQASQQPGR